MKKERVNFVFDRRKVFAKSDKGVLEVQVKLKADLRKFIKIGEATPDTWMMIAEQPSTKVIVEKCRQVLAAMEMLDVEMNTDNFNFYYTGEHTKKKDSADSLSKNFITYIKNELENENIAKGTRRNKEVVISAIEQFGQIIIYRDSTARNIIEFDEWLRDGTRSDVTIYGYHKRLHVWISRLHQKGEIPVDPYKSVTLKHGKSKERKPLTESELKQLRDIKLSPKLDRVRDLFVFAAYTGLSYIDTQNFDFETMTVKMSDGYYIDSKRIKTSTPFYTPILEPAMSIMKKYNYVLPHITNEKANDYLHVIQEKMGLNKSLTFHVARHTFATLALSHDVPIENVARMLGHEDIRTTKVYAKVLNSTIERHGAALRKELV